MKRIIVAAISTISVLLLSSSSLFSEERGTRDYAEGKACYHQLLASGASASEDAFRECITFFEDFFRANPDGSQALSSLFSAARLKQEHYALRGNSADAEGAIKDYNQLVRHFPASSLADDALFRIGCLREDAFAQPERARKAFAHLLEHYPKGDMALQAEARLRKIDQVDAGQVSASAPLEVAGDVAGDTMADAAAVTTKASDNVPVADGVAAAQSRSVPTKDAGGATETVIEERDLDAAAPPGASQSVTRRQGVADAFHPATLVDIEMRRTDKGATALLALDRDVVHSVEFTEMGARTGSPPRLDVILLHTRPASGLSDERLVESGAIDGFEVKRLILSSGIKVSFTLKPGIRYAVSKTGEGLAVVFTGAGAAEVLPGAASPVAGGKRPAAKIQGLSIVVDAGHGGDEEGAVGPDGTMEKDVTLALSRLLAAELRAKLGAKVFLTRDDDRTLSLEERNAIAVTKKADLFISIHANASRDAHASGVETYFLNNATDEAAERLAARENKSAMKQLPEVEHIISTMLQNYDAAESRVLADAVQERLSKKLTKSHGEMKDRGVRSALFYVLVGAKCPAILVETAFISNPREEKLLGKDAFQRNAAQAIADGVKQYLKVRDKALVSL